MNYAYSKKVDLSFDDAVKKIKDELLKEGFGVLTEIDVKNTLKKKIDVDFDDYIILGACNPVFAHKALVVEREVGLFLPCNVVVYRSSEGVFISTIVPSVAMSVIENDELKLLADEVEGRLKRSIDNI